MVTAVLLYSSYVSVVSFSHRDYSTDSLGRGQATLLVRTVVSPPLVMSDTQKQLELGKILFILLSEREWII